MGFPDPHRLPAAAGPGVPLPPEDDTAAVLKCVERAALPGVDFEALRAAVRRTEEAGPGRAGWRMEWEEVGGWEVPAAEVPPRIGWD